MTMFSTIPAVEVPAPAVTSPPFGLLDTVTATPIADQHWEGGGLWWRGRGCNTTGVTFTPCSVGAPDPIDALASTMVCSVPVVTTFTVYAYTDETAPVATAARREAVTDALLDGEEAAVEAQLWAAMVAEAGAADGTAGSAKEAIAMADALARSVYSGTPVLHVPPYEATLAGGDGTLVREGRRLRTFLGSDVIAGSGYGTPPAAAGAGADVFATGQLVIARSNVFDVGAGELVMNPRTNELHVLVARTYAVGWDCAIVRVTIPAAP